MKNNSMIQISQDKKKELLGYALIASVFTALILLCVFAANSAPIAFHWN
jgi:hypothetical protein